MFVSLIVPSFNQGRFVGDCLRSIVSQSGASSEIILVDGGSTDGTLAVVEEFRGSITHFISEPDAGQADAINKGLRLARGELVTWLNSDDFLEPGALDHMRAAAGRAPHAPFYMGLGSRTDRDGKTRVSFYPEHFEFRREALLWGLNFVLQPATFMRRTALEQIGGTVATALRYALDTDLWIRLSGLGDPVLVPHLIACSREYAETKTAQGGWERFREIQQVAAAATGAALTPGVLAELMRLLHEQWLADPAVRARLPAETEQRILAGWAVAADGLRNLTGREDGFPIGGTNAVGRIPGKRP